LASQNVEFHYNFNYYISLNMTANFSLELTAEKLEPTLRAYQAHWQDVLSKYEPLVEHARAQLTYVEGLLNGLSALPDPIANSHKVADLKVADAEVKVADPVSTISTTDSTTDVVPPITTVKTKARKKSAIASLPVEEEKPVPVKLKKAPKPTKKPSAPKPAVSLAPFEFSSKYSGKTLTAAVEQILSERDGQAVSIEDVVAVLYDELDSEQFKVAKDRVTKNLSKGKVTGLWDRVPEKSGYYTFSAASLES
jgi:hypothetical protein